MQAAGRVSKCLLPSRAPTSVGAGSRVCERPRAAPFMCSLLLQRCATRVLSINERKKCQCGSRVRGGVGRCGEWACGGVVVCVRVGVCVIHLSRQQTEENNHERKQQGNSLRKEQQGQSVREENAAATEDWGEDGMPLRSEVCTGGIGTGSQIGFARQLILSEFGERVCTVMGGEPPPAAPQCVSP